MNRRLIQKELDTAAEELDRKGYRDLANRVDHYNARLMKAKQDSEIQLIARALGRIDKESDRRDEVFTRRPKTHKSQLDRELPPREEAENRKERLAKIRRRIALRRKIRARRKAREEEREEQSPRSLRKSRLARMKKRLERD
jgi:hypothetical protein